MNHFFVLLVAGTLSFGDTIDYMVLRDKLALHPALTGAEKGVVAQEDRINDRGVPTPIIETMSRVDGQEQQVTLSQMIPRKSELTATRLMRENQRNLAKTAVLQSEYRLTVQLRTLLINLEKSRSELTIYRQQEQLYGSMIKLMKVRSSTMDDAPEITMASIDSAMAAQNRIGSESDQIALIRQIEALVGKLSSEPVLGEPWRRPDRPAPQPDSSVMIRMASDDIAMSEADLAMQKSGYFPDLMGMVSLERQAMGTPDPMWQKPMVGLSFSLPVAIGRQKSRVAGAESAVESQKAKRESIRWQLNAQLAAAAEAERLAVQRETNYRQRLIPDADRMIDLQRRRYSTGAGSAASVLLALRQKTDLELMAVESAYMGEMNALMIEEMSGSSRLRIKGERR